MKKDIGIDVKAPAGKCTSVKCPWHGKMSVRGRVFVGKVVSSKASQSAVVSWNFYTYISKYQRRLRKKTRVSVHNPLCINARVGDTVTIAECRPLSSTKSFVIVEKQ